MERKKQKYVNNTMSAYIIFIYLYIADFSEVLLLEGFLVT